MPNDTPLDALRSLESTEIISDKRIRDMLCTASLKSGIPLFHVPHPSCRPNYERVMKIALRWIVDETLARERSRKREIVSEGG